jgi:hypothetical protein
VACLAASALMLLPWWFRLLLALLDWETRRKSAGKSGLVV